MRKFTLVTLAMMASASCFAQTILWNGEDTSITGKANAGFWPDANPELVDNPEKDGINTSDHCLKFVISKDNKVVKLPFREWMQPLMNGSKRVSLMIKKGAAENVKVELSDPTDGSAGYWKKQVVWYGGGDKWQKLVFDFTSNGDFDKPGLMTITAQTGDVNTEQTVYIDNIVIEDAPKINGKLLSDYNAESPITGNLTLTGAWMKGSSINADDDNNWKENTYNDFEYFNSQATDGVTSIDMCGTVTKDVDINQFFKNPNTIVYADDTYGHNNVVVNGTVANLVLTDANAFNAPEGFTAANVKLTRKVQKGFNSFVLPFAATAVDLGATKVATFKETNGDIANFETADKVDANTPFLTMGAAKTDNLTFTNKAIDATTDNLGTDFVGVYAPTSGKGKYGINDKGELQKGGADAKLNAFHAYLNVSEAKPAPARIALNGSILTAINGIVADKVVDTAVYDISGRRVYGKLHKGLYIMNGKKVVVK